MQNQTIVRQLAVAGTIALTIYQGMLEQPMNKSDEAMDLSSVSSETVRYELPSLFDGGAMLLGEQPIRIEDGEQLVPLPRKRGIRVSVRQPTRAKLRSVEDEHGFI